VEYDDKGNVGAVYKTDFEGKRTNLPFSTETNTSTKNSRLIDKRIDEAKKAAKHPQTKVEEKTPAKPRISRVVKKAPQAISTGERLS
jgi:hypothetical protein